ncbi:hypothetical protein NQZ68_002619 [Dissostichus eleginoides]|nr:hypothetical protein NQZ68_002619 [Dissostichus eleginoides]
MIHAADPGDWELMPSQWQRSKTLTQIQLCPPGDGQMDIANVSPVPGVSIIEPRKREKTDMSDHNDAVTQQAEVRQTEQPPPPTPHHPMPSTCMNPPPSPSPLGPCPGCGGRGVFWQADPERGPPIGQEKGDLE